MAGPQGPQGTVGPVGPTGNIGGTGPQVPQGTVGPVGPTGNIGGTGPQGPQGTVGPVGPTGNEARPTGPLGPTGNAGATGPGGSTGPTGQVGITGADGSPGADAPYVVIGFDSNVDTNAERTAAIRSFSGLSTVLTNSVYWDAITGIPYQNKAAAASNPSLTALTGSSGIVNMGIKLESGNDRVELTFRLKNL